MIIRAEQQAITGSSNQDATPLAGTAGIAPIVSTQNLKMSGDPRLLRVTGSSPTGPAMELAPPSSANTRSASAVRLTQADNGTSVTVQRGRTLILELPSNASTGYQWMLNAPVPHSNLEEKYVHGGVNLPGAGGTQRFTWRTLSGPDYSETVQVELEYKRPWEQNGSSPRPPFRFTLTLDGTRSLPLSH
jgi:predicted secreted protein